MAGTLVISTLSDGTNSTSSTNCIQGSAKAWVNFNGTTSPGTISAQYNVTSVTKNGTGDFTLNFTNALSNANYSALVLANVGSNLTYVGAKTATTTTLRFSTRNSSGTAVDADTVSAAVFR